MKEKKNIDNLFKENFSGQEIAPPELVWTNIERELKKKKERKVFPIWWKFAGVAAVLLIGILIGKEFFGNKNSNIIPVSSIEIKSSLNKDIINQELKNKKNEVLVSNDHNEKSNNKSTSIKDKKNIIPKNEVLVSNERDELSNEKKANKLFSNKRKLILNRTNSIANNSIISNKNIYKDTNNTNDRNDIF